MKVITKEQLFDDAFDSFKLAVSNRSWQLRAQTNNPECQNAVDALERLFVYELELLRRKIKDG